MTGGLTNINYLIKVEDVPYFVRVPGESTELLAVDRANEYFNTKAAAKAGIGPNVLYHLPEHNIMVLKFIQAKQCPTKNFRHLDYRSGLPSRSRYCTLDLDF